MQNQQIFICLFFFQKKDFFNFFHLHILRFFMYFFILVKYTPWQHGEQAVQWTIATLSTQYEPLNKNKQLLHSIANKQLLHTIASTILVLFFHFLRTNTACSQ